MTTNQIVLVLALFVCACKPSSDTHQRDRALRSADAAVVAMNAADASFPADYQAGLSQLTSKLMINAPVAAADVLKTDVLPMIDRYVAKIDAAVSASDAYFALAPDRKLEASMDKVRARGVAMHRLRDRMAGLEAKARGGAPSDELNAEPASIGLELSFGS